MSNGIDFVIGGKDKASPAMSSTENSMKRLEAATGKLKTSTVSLMGAMAPLLAIYAAVKAAMAFVGGVKAANEAFDAQTEAVRKLDNALKIRGAQAMSGSMQAMAKEVQKVTGTSDNLVISLMQQAAGMGFAADRMDDAAKAALGLAQATGKDAAASMADLKAALEGNFEAFHAINPQIMYMRSNQEKMAAVLAIANQGLQEQAGDMNTVAGSGRRAESAMQSLKEMIGTVLAPFRVLINAGIEQFSNSIQEVLAPAVEYAKQLLANIGPVMQWVKERVVDGVNIIVGAWTFLEVILTNLAPVWDMVATAAELAMVKLEENFSYILGEVIPAVAKWFVDNFFNLMRDGLNAAYTVTINRITKMIDAFKALWDFIISGGQTDIAREIGEIAGRDLLEGFESSLTAFPEIAGRQITEREKDLADRIGSMGGRLGAEFAAKMKSRMVGVGETLESELAAVSKLDLKARNAVVMQGINVTEGRLLTRGSSSTNLTIPQMMGQIIQKMDQLLEKPGIKGQNKDNGRLANAVDNIFANPIQVVMVQ